MNVRRGILQHDGSAVHWLERGRFATESADVTHRFAVGIAAATALFLLSACASSNNYMGISLAAGQANPELQHLAARARAGDKQAQLELGIKFEDGHGLERDIEKARNLYRLAASDSGGPTWIYVPPTVKGRQGRVIPVTRGGKAFGLDEAKARLELLEQPE